MAANKNLENVIEIENENYNINAVHSETAGQTTGKLTFKKKLLNGNEEVVVFDGSSNRTISIVPPTGGIFSGGIQLQSQPSLNSTKTADLATAVNLGSVKTIIKNLAGHPCCTWDGNDLVFETVDGDEESLQKVSLITGTHTNFTSFINQKPKPVFFLYICTDSGAIYFGTSAESDYIQLGTQASSAYTAEELVTPTGLGQTWTAENISTAFGSNTEAHEQLTAKIDTDIQALRDSHDDDIENIKKTINAKAGALKSNISDVNSRIDDIEDGNTVVSKASKDALGTTIRTGYYRSAHNTTNANTITISTADPSGGSNGDIWIKY